MLSPLEPVAVQSEAELLARLVPGEDGLVIAWRGSRATFLPKVWDQLRDPVEFLRHLKHKAGWSPDFWAEDVEVWRYFTESVAAPGTNRRRMSHVHASPSPCCSAASSPPCSWSPSRPASTSRCGSGAGSPPSPTAGGPGRRSRTRTSASSPSTRGCSTRNAGSTARVGWFVAIMLLGNIAMAIYVLAQLARLRPGEPAANLLLRRE